MQERTGGIMNKVEKLLTDLGDDWHTVVDNLKSMGITASQGCDFTDCPIAIYLKMNGCSFVSVRKDGIRYKFKNGASGIIDVSRSSYFYYINQFMDEFDYGRVKGLYSYD